MRTQEPIPDWITHVAIIEGGKVTAGQKKDVLGSRASKVPSQSWASARLTEAKGKVLVDLKNAQVTYNGRQVCIVCSVD
jgi:hypothetical protein